MFSLREKSHHVLLGPVRVWVEVKGNVNEWSGTWGGKLKAVLQTKVLKAPGES